MASLPAGIARVARTARDHAADVDAKGRFPHEALDAMRATAALVPDEATTIVEIAGWVAAVARYCGSSGLVLAMHHALLATLRAAAPQDEWVARYLSDGARLQPLIAGLTSEATTGGDLGRSTTAVERDGDMLRIVKSVPAASYVGDADAVFVTARRSTDAAPSDQVVVVATRQQVEVTATGDWDALGMRGTMSGPADVAVAVPAEQRISRPFGDVASVLVGASHTLWAACWAGIAASAVDASRARLRRRAVDATPDILARLAELADAAGDLASMWALVSTAAARVDAGDVDTARAQVFFNNVKTVVSRGAVDTVVRCVELVGIEAYASSASSDASMSRQVRDVLSALVMVSNHRIRAATGITATLAASEVPGGPADIAAAEGDRS